MIHSPSQKFRDINSALPHLMKQVVENGLKQDSRNGLTSELMMQQIVLTDPSRYEIYTAERKASLPAQIAETMWVLAGRNDIEWLSHYLPRAADFSDNGKTWRAGYGPRIRSWSDGTPYPIDQLAHVVKLLREDPASRRAVINIYDPAVDTAPGKDIACNNWLHFLPRDGVLHLHVATRSNDLMWGWSGINAFEWTVLLNVVAGLTGLKRGSVTFAISSLHLYEPYFDKAARIAKAGIHRSPWDKEPVPSPQFEFSSFDGNMEYFDRLVAEWFAAEALIRKDAADVTVHIMEFPEPMMGSWLWALYYWHRGTPEQIATQPGLRDTALEAALLASPPRKTAEAPKAAAKPAKVPQAAKDFTEFAAELHADKNAVYGSSWKKRGEMLSIMANIARKIDRLGDAGGGDTAADTAVDLLVYLIKYDLWLAQEFAAPGQYSVDLTEGENHVGLVTDMLVNLERHSAKWQQDTDQDLINGLKELFEDLYHQVEEKRVSRQRLVQSLLEPAYLLALSLWDQERRAEHEAAQKAVQQAKRSMPAQPPLPPKPHVEVTGSGLVIHTFPDAAFGDGKPDDVLPHTKVLQRAAKAVEDHAARNATRMWNPEQDDAQ